MCVACVFAINVILWCLLLFVVGGVVVVLEFLSAVKFFVGVCGCVMVFVFVSLVCLFEVVV